MKKQEEAPKALQKAEPASKKPAAPASKAKK